MLKENYQYPIELKEIKKPNEFALIIIKPVGQKYKNSIIDILKQYGRIEEMRDDVQLSEEQLDEHYNDLPKRGLRAVKYGLMEHMSSNKVTVFILERDPNDSSTKELPGEGNFCEQIRKHIIGHRDPAEIPKEKRKEQIRGLVSNKPEEYEQFVSVNMGLKKVPINDTDPHPAKIMPLQQEKNAIPEKQPSLPDAIELKKAKIKSEQKAKIPLEQKRKFTEPAKYLKIIRTMDNLIHCSANTKEARNEIKNLYADQPEVLERFTN